MITVSHPDAGDAKWLPSPAGDRAVAPSEKSGIVTKIIAKWEAAVNFIVPVGFEDPSGFHFGEPAGDSRITSAAYDRPCEDCEELLV